MAAVAVWGGGHAEWMAVVFAAAAASAAASLARPVAGRVRTVRAGDVTVKQYGFTLAGDWFARLEGRLSAVRSLKRRLSGSLRGAVMRTGSPHDVEHTATLTVRLVVLAAPLSAAAAAALYFAVGPPALAILAAPAAVYAAPGAALRMRASERRSGAEGEAAYFLCYVNIMQTAGHDLYHSFEHVDPDVFPAAGRDAREITKRVKLLGMTKHESLSRYAAGHPYAEMRNFVDGYLAKLSSVGNVPLYTESKAAFFFEEYRGAWKRYEKNAQEIFSGIMMLAVILPMMITLSAMIGTGESVGLLVMVGTVLSAPIAAAMITALNSAQPATGISAPFPAAVPVAGLAAGVTAFFSGAGPGIAVAAACLTGAAAGIMLTGALARRAAAIDRTLPEFMRDVTEMSKAGWNVTRIVTEQARRGAYRGHFGAVLGRMAADLRRGLPFRDAARRAGADTADFRFLFFLLEKTQATGGGTAAAFSMIAEFIGGVRQAREQVKKSLAPLTMIAYASPFLILGVAHVMIGMMSGGAAGPDVPDAMFMGGRVADDAFVAGLELMAAATAIPMGFVAAKVSSFTVKNMAPPAMVSLTTILAITFTEEAVRMSGLFPGGA